MSFSVKKNYIRPISVVLIVACLSGISGCTRDSTPPNSQNPVAASPGGLSEKWAHVNSRGDVVESLDYDVDQKILIESTEPSSALSGFEYNGNTEITAINPSDGTLLWHTHIGAVKTWEILSSGSFVAIVPDTSALLGNGQASMPILNARSGSLVHTIILNDDATVDGFSRGNLIIESPNRAQTEESMSAVAPGSGTLIWSHRWIGCTPANALTGHPVADDETIAAVISCSKGNSIFVISVNPLNGHQVWRRPVETADDTESTSSDNSGFSVKQGVILFAGHTEAIIFSPVGRPYKVPIASDTSPSLGVSGQHAQLAYESSDGQITIKVIDLETDATLRSEILPDYPFSTGLISAYFSGSIADLVIALPQSMLPLALMQVNLTDGSRSFSALPFALRFAPQTPDYVYGSTLAAAVSDEKIEGFSLTAPAGHTGRAEEAPELQGTPARWPQACSFAPRHLLSIILAGRNFLTIKKAIPPHLGLPNASTCELVGRTAVAPVPIFISVSWDATSGRQAHDLFDNSLGGLEANGAYGGNHLLRGPWDEAWYGGQDYPVPDDIKFRVGKLILEIYDAAKLPVAKILARAITRELHASDGIR